MKKIFFAAPFVVLLSFIPIQKIKFNKAVTVDVLEPSDICLAADNQNFYVAGNRGMIAKVTPEGKVINSYDNAGADYEGVTLLGNDLYVVDETYRRVDKFDATTLKKISSVYLRDNGGMNKSFEGITYNPERKIFITITESPVSIHEYNEEWFEKNVIDETAFKEASSILYHKGFVWILSDEKRTVYQVNQNDYSIINQWQIPVLNPEGICFDANENLIIQSDDRQTIYTFSPLNYNAK